MMKHTLLTLLLLAACAAAALGRDFTVATISDTNAPARLPVISSTGLVAWQQSAPRADDGGRIGVDICTWKDGTLANRTADNPIVAGHSYRPRVFGDSVVFSAVVDAKDESGIPFRLAIPDKTEAMTSLEEDYPSLFGPVATENSAPEAASEEAPSDNPDAPAPPRSKGGVRGTGMTPDVILCEPDGTIRRITAGNTEYTFPVGSDSALAFLCARTWPYGYDLVAWKTGAGELTQITTNYFYVQNPCIHGHELVFQAWDGHDYEIYLHDFDTGETRAVTQNNFDDTEPVVWDGVVAWIAHPTVNAEIFICEDGTTISKISSGSTENASPSIWEGRVVWQGVDDDGDLEIYYYHNRRTVKLTSNTWDDIAPKIADGMVAWSSYIDNWDAEAVVLDLSDNILFRLTDNAYEDINVQTAGERVVWQTIAPEAPYINLATPAAPRESEIP